MGEGIRRKSTEVENVNQFGRWGKKVCACINVYIFFLPRRN